MNKPMANVQSIVIYRFLHRPQFRSGGDQLIQVKQNKIDRLRSRFRESDRQMEYFSLRYWLDRYLMMMHVGKEKSHE